MKKIFILFTLIFVGQIGISQPFSIGVRTITFEDPSRQEGIFFPSDREIETRIYYPAQAAGNNQAAIQGDFPLIVIGHGFGMNSQHYENYWEELVPRGYIVALPRTESAVIPFPSHPDFALDLAFVENAMFLQNANSSSPFFQTLRQSSAIMGHSMGGGCTFVAAENNPSPRLKTIVGLAAAETNVSAIDAAQNVTVDALVFGGSGDGVTPPADNQIPMYNNLSSQCKYYVEITGGGHCNFASPGSVCEVGEIFTGGNQLGRAQQHLIIYSFLNPWLDFKLKEDCNAWDVFQNELSTSSDVTFQSSCNYVVTPDIEISPIGNIDLCFGETINLTGNTNPNYTYQWFNTNGTINGADNNQFTVLESGSYFLEATTVNFGCKDTSSLAIVNIAGNDTTFVNLDVCSGSSITLDNGVSVNNDTIIFGTFTAQTNCDSVVQYTVNEVLELIQTESFNLCFGDSILLPDNTYASENGSFSFNFTSNATGCDSTYNVIINIAESSVTNVTNINICEGDSFQLPNGSFISVEGLYDGDTLLNNFGCDSIFRKFDLNVLQFPTIDSVFVDLSASMNTIEFILFEATAYDSIYWESDLTILNNTQNTDTLLLQVPDPVNDSVTLTLFNASCFTSQTLYFDRTWNSINNIEMNSINIYPNPTNNIITINLSQNNHFEQDITIFNSLGKAVYKGKCSKQNNQIDVSHLASGLYTIISNNAHAKFIKKE